MLCSQAPPGQVSLPPLQFHHAGPTTLFTDLSSQLGWKAPTLTLGSSPQTKIFAHSLGGEIQCQWIWHVFLKFWWKQLYPIAGLSDPTQTTNCTTWRVAVICMLRDALANQSIPRQSGMWPQSTRVEPVMEVSNTHWGPTGTPPMICILSLSWTRALGLCGDSWLISSLQLYGHTLNMTGFSFFTIWISWGFSQPLNSASLLINTFIDILAILPGLPQPGVKPVPSVVRSNHWTAREFSMIPSLNLSLSWILLLSSQ